MAKILIVDDRVSNRELMLTLLGYAGHQLFEAKEGVEGLEITRAEHPDLIITDIMMPKMDGYEFARQVRADDSIKDIQIIFYTSSYIIAETLRLAKSCGVSIVIGKPIEPEIFLKKISEALNTKPAPIILPASDEEFHREHMRMLTDTLVNKVELLEAEILERKQIESILHASELRFRSLIENGLDSISLIGADGALLWESPSANRMLGYQHNEFIGKNIFELVHPEDIEQITLQFKDLISQPRTAQRESFRLRHASGGWRWVEAIGTNLMDEPSVKAIVINYRDVTERRQAEQALRNSEAQFRSIIELSPIPYALNNEKQNITFLNRAFTTTFGYDLNDIPTLDEWWPRAYPDPDYRKWVAKTWQIHLDKAKKEGTPFQPLELNICCKDGSIRTALVGAGSLTGSFMGEHLVILYDITDRKKAEQALRNSEEQYRSLFEDSPISLWVEDFSEVKKRLDQLKKEKSIDISAYIQAHPEFIAECVAQVKILDVNQATLKLYHASHKDHLLGSLQGTALPISSEDFEFELIQLANGKLNFEREGIDQTLTGEKINVNIHWTVVPGYEETLEKIIVSTIDITERKQSEEKIQRQIKRLNALRHIDLAISNSFDLNQSLDVLLNATLSELDVSAASILLFDEDTSALEYRAGKGFYSTGIQQTNIRLGEGLAGESALENRIVFISNLAQAGEKFVRANLLKEERFVSYYGIPLVGKGKLQGVLEIFNRTELRPDKDWSDFFELLAGQAAIAIDNAQLFENLQRSNLELERRVADRTAQLNKINRELEHANRAKDEFLANMSHELRTPLNSILGLSESLLEQIQGKLNPSQQKSLQIIESSGVHLLDLINDVLDLSKIEAGKFDYYPQPIRVDDLCKSSLIFVKTQAMKKNITLTYEIEDTISDFYADPRRVKQILVNLLTNAVKFTPNNGHVTLKVNVIQDVIQFSVIDTGIGIAPDDLRKLFTPFVQVESSLKRNFEGTGLGLALVQKLTDLHGGSVEVESEIGKGSRFTIKLPYQKDVAGQASEPEKFIPHSMDIQIDFQPDKEGKNKKILLVEDNAANILTIGEYLENHGYEVIIANDGVQAIEKANETKPNVILMDIQMPVMDGLEATRRLRSDVQFASVPIIALTALAMPGDRERCLEAGATEYMSKPVSLKELRKMIESYFDSPK